ncbi:MAG: AraC-like DNA-binding protein [Flavobacteriales bacterium]|jgi:AraC-like DNA-binding protein
MLNDLFHLLRLRAEVYNNARTCGNWHIPESHIGQTCFHMPTQNSCRLHIPGHEDTTLYEGELVLFPREIPHSMTTLSQTDTPYERHSYHHHDPDGTALICGRICFQHAGKQALLDALPPVIIIRQQASQQWLPALLQLILHESFQSDNGSTEVLDRLCELIFIHTLRHLVEQHAHEGQETEPSVSTTKLNGGILALYSNQRLAPAIHSIHTKPSHSWSLETLAQSCHMSRTAFTKLFKENCSWTPMRYLSWWRMQLAYSKLRDGENVAQTAASIGYSSEAAFSRAFSKEFGMHAGKVRSMKHVTESLPRYLF